MSTTDLGALASYLGFTIAGTKDGTYYTYVSENAEYCLSRFEDFEVDFEAWAIVPTMVNSPMFN